MLLEDLPQDLQALVREHTDYGHNVDGVGLAMAVARLYGAPTLIPIAASDEGSSDESSTTLEDEVEALRLKLARTYSERNELAVAFARMALHAGLSAGRGFDSDSSKPWSESWRHVVYVNLPNGEQVSWHMAPDDVGLLEDLPGYAGEWDGTFLARQPGWSGKV